MYNRYARIGHNTVRCPKCHGLSIVSYYAIIDSENMIIYRVYCKSLRCTVRYFTAVYKDDNISIVGVKTYKSIKHKKETLKRILKYKYENGNPIYREMVRDKYVKLCSK